MMDVFECIAVMVTVVLALAVSHILTSLATMVANLERVRLYWVHPLSAILLLGLNPQACWSCEPSRTIRVARRPDRHDAVVGVSDLRCCSGARAAASAWRMRRPPQPLLSNSASALLDTQHLLPPSNLGPFALRTWPAARAHDHWSDFFFRSVAVRRCGQVIRLARDPCDPLGRLSRRQRDLRLG